MAFRMDSIEYFLEHELVFADEVGEEGDGDLFHVADVEFGLVRELCQHLADFLQVFLFGCFVEGERDLVIVDHVDVDPSFQESLI